MGSAAGVCSGPPSRELRQLALAQLSQEVLKFSDFRSEVQMAQLAGKIGPRQIYIYIYIFAWLVENKGDPKKAKRKRGN